MIFAAIAEHNLNFLFNKRRRDNMSHVTSKRKKTLSSNMEDYLETIHILAARGKPARVKDVSDMMGVRKPSVHNAVKILAEKGLVNHERYGRISLTSKGAEVSGKIKNRHDMLIRFLVEVLGVGQDAASADACRIEHVISAETSRKLGEFLESSGAAAEGKDHLRRDKAGSVPGKIKTGRITRGKTKKRGKSGNK